MSCGADRHTACAFNLISVNKCVIVANFNVNYQFGIMNVNRQMRKSVKYFFADRHADGRGVKRKFFVRTFRIYFKCFRKCQIILKVFAGGGNYNVHILFNSRTTGDSRDSEYHFDPSECLVKIYVLIDRFNDNC